jgi:hypothetical protein
MNAIHRRDYGSLCFVACDMLRVSLRHILLTKLPIGGITEGYRHDH